MNIAERKRVSDVFTNDKFPDFCFPESRGGAHGIAKSYYTWFVCVRDKREFSMISVGIAFSMQDTIALQLILREENA